MLTKAKHAFENRIYSLGREGQLYIVPTLDGLKLLALNLILLVTGLVYANNYVLLFNFILFCLFIGSMFYTHFNLQGLQLVAAKLEPLHVKEGGTLVLNFRSLSTLGHHFLNARFENPLVSISDEPFSFSIKETVHSQKLEIPILARKRGVANLNRICIETRFPFHLFRAFTYFDIKLKVVVFPEKRKLYLHDTLLLPEEQNTDESDYTLKNFQPGDSLGRIHWKKFAQTGKLLSKQLTSFSEAPVLLGFSTKNLSKEERENELSSICFSLHELHSQGINYGLVLNQTMIKPGHSQIHLSKCLKALAEYES